LYTTSNYTAKSPRCRVVILLDKEVNRSEGKRVCEGIEAEINLKLRLMAASDPHDSWEPVIEWDKSVYMAEQQCYTPVANLTGELKTKTGETSVNAITCRFDGKLANVEHYLFMVPAEPKKESSHAWSKLDINKSDGETQNPLDCMVSEHMLEDLRDALFSPAMLDISSGSRKPWQAVIARLCSLKETLYEESAYQLALEWSEAGGAAFDLDVFNNTWATSRADNTSFQAIFSEAQNRGWQNAQKLRPYIQLEKTGFYLTTEGLMENFLVGKDGRAIQARKLTAPFIIRGRTRDAYGGNWGRLVEFSDPDGETRHYVVPDEQLHKQGSEIPQRLSSKGLWIGNNAGKSLLAYLNLTPTENRIVCTSMTGWFKNGVFVLPDRTIGDITDQHAGRDKCQLAQSGTLAEWKQHIASKCTGNSRLAFSVSVALAAPLMDITGMDGGVFSLLGASTKGKSTAQHVAASVWGKGTTSGGYVRTWNTSMVGLEIMAATHNDLPLILDELKAVSSKVVGSAAYMLAMGRGKERGTKDIALRETLQWRTLVLASSEKPFDSYLKAAGETMEAGQQARFVDIPAIVNEDIGVFEDLHGLPRSEESAKSFADQLNCLAALHYGTAGIAWLEYLTNLERSVLMARIESLRLEFRQQYRPEHTGSQLDRVMERFILCAIAGELATSAGITGWQEGEAFKGTGKCFQAYVNGRGTLRDMEGVNGVEHLKQYLSDNRSSTFMSCSSDKVRVHDGYITLMNDECVTAFNDLDDVQTEGVDECYWILPEAMKRILMNHNFVATVNELENLGVLRSKQDIHGRVEHNPRMIDPVQNHRRRYYRINSSKLFL
jgi:Superfamily II helicase and inactivated derivatives